MSKNYIFYKYIMNDFINIIYKAKKLLLIIPMSILAYKNNIKSVLNL